jgi:PAS domain S-box-containing protein
MEDQPLIKEEFGEKQCDMLFDMDLMGRITMVRLFNKDLSEKLGYTEQELLGENVTDFLVDAQSVAGAQHFGKLYASEAAFRAKSRRITLKNGQSMIAESYLMPMYDPENKLIGHRGMEFFIFGPQEAGKKGAQ